MQGTFIFVGAAAIFIGTALYFYMPTQSPNSASSTAYPASTASDTKTYTVDFRVLDTGSQASGVSVRKNYAAYTEEGFIKLWKLAYSTDTVLPKVDFSKEYVIGVFAGQKSTGGNSIAVTSVTDAGDVRTVAITLTSPGASCIVTEGLTNPYQIVAVPMSTLSLTHANTEVSTLCN